MVVTVVVTVMGIQRDTKGGYVETVVGRSPRREASQPFTLTLTLTLTVTLTLTQTLTLTLTLTDPDPNPDPNPNPNPNPLIPNQLATLCIPRYPPSVSRNPVRVRPLYPSVSLCIIIDLYPSVSLCIPLYHHRLVGPSSSPLSVS